MRLSKDLLIEEWVPLFILLLLTEAGGGTKIHYIITFVLPERSSLQPFGFSKTVAVSAATQPLSLPERLLATLQVMQLL